MSRIEQHEIIPNDEQIGLKHRQAILLGGIILTATGAFIASAGYSQMTKFDDRPNETPVTGEVHSYYGTLHNRGEVAAWAGGALAISGVGVVASSKIVSRTPKRPNLF